MNWLALSSTEEDHRVYTNARIFVALRKCLVTLHTFYTNLQKVPVLIPHQPHSRYFPYPTSFTDTKGDKKQFRYLTALEQDAACVTYLAEIIAEPPSSEKLVVKFVARYSRKVHELLARDGYAPSLRYCGPMPGAKHSRILSTQAQFAFPGLNLRSDLMYMVVMDYIVTQPTRPPDARHQLEGILTTLHSHGYVYGDLRAQNILFDEGKVKLIDFNWCGRYNVRICNDLEELPRELQGKINDFTDNSDEPYACYPLSMSTLPDMWALGMEPLTEIRPLHDWKMLKKLSW